MRKLLVVAAVVLAASVLARAGRSGGTERGSSARRMMPSSTNGRHTKGFVAAQEQQAKIVRLHEAAWDCMAWLCGALDLSEEQQALIEEIRENAREAAEAAETPEARREIMQTAHEEIMAVLTEEQLDKLEQMRARLWQGKAGPWGPRSGREYMAWLFAALELSKQQQASIEEIRENAREAAEAAKTPEARREIIQAAHQEIMAILTEVQLEKLEQIRARLWQGRGGPWGPGGGREYMAWLFGALELSEQQQALIEEIRENAREAAEAAATPEARRQIIQAAHQEIMAVLTDEQIEQLEQMCERRSHSWGSRRRLRR